MTGGAVMDVAQQKFPGYFDWLNDLSHGEADLVTAIISDFEALVNFASLAPAMVSDIYENALLTRSQRRAQGTFYTPPWLARRMLEMLPIEHVPPDRRSILTQRAGRALCFWRQPPDWTRYNPHKRIPVIVTSTLSVTYAVSIATDLRST